MSPYIDRAAAGNRTEAEVRALRELYATWEATEAAWGKELEAAFPTRWPGDVRFLIEGQGEPGTPLRAAYEARTKAQAAFYDAGGADWLMGRPKA